MLIDWVHKIKKEKKNRILLKITTIKYFKALKESLNKWRSVNSYSTKKSKSISHNKNLQINKKIMQLNLIKLIESIKYFKKSFMKYSFFQIKQNSKNLFLHKIERIALLTRIVNKKMEFNRFMLKNAFVNLKKNTSSKVSHSHSFTTIKDRNMLPKTIIYIMKPIIYRIISNSFMDVKYSLKHLDKSNCILRESLKKALPISPTYNSTCDKSSSGIGYSYFPSFLVNPGIHHFVDIIHNKLNKNVFDCFKHIELSHILNRNRENAYINVALKIMIIYEGHKNQLKREFLKRLYQNSQLFEERVVALDRILSKNHYKTLMIYFNKFRNEVTNIKLNQTMISNVIKSLKIAVEIFEKFERLIKNDAFRAILNYGNRTISMHRSNISYSSNNNSKANSRKEVLQVKHLVFLIASINRLFLKDKSYSFKYF